MQGEYNEGWPRSPGVSLAKASLHTPAMDGQTFGLKNTGAISCDGTRCVHPCALIANNIQYVQRGN